MLNRLKIRTRMAAVFGLAAAGLFVIACLAAWQVSVLRSNLAGGSGALPYRSVFPGRSRSGQNRSVTALADAAHSAGRAVQSIDPAQKFAPSGRAAVKDATGGTVIA
jgi:hypothetical protein